MSNSSVGDNIDSGNASWKFSGKMVKDFEKHVAKSVPLYNEGHDIILKISDYFVKDDSICYEIGTSTGVLSNKLAKRFTDRDAKFIGLDIEEDMVDNAKERYKMSNLSFEYADVLEYTFSPSDFITSYYVVQFIRPSQRQLLIDKIYNSLNWGGAFLYFEKVRAPDARFQDIMTGIYNEYKLEQGYSAEEIVQKSRSLKGVLEPFSTQGNIDMLKRAGFIDIMSVAKFGPFEGILAIK
ncbi:tRNA (uridine-5-oxyacetic acid methyl ester) 34 synthase [hydrothermal vent metagenome]|uniref:tRNA (Uridine-5-oxyacetic acid methyl ester) 34 synthase n=1 Tax=hydrothermal vent metagenome TaxID=652676 RepID=A0A1W1CME8_9ZZZZ